MYLNVKLPNLDLKQGIYNLEREGRGGGETERKRDRQRQRKQDIKREKERELIIKITGNAVLPN
jgi:hypothetical protein